MALPNFKILQPQERWVLVGIAVLFCALLLGGTLSLVKLFDQGNVSLTFIVLVALLIVVAALCVTVSLLLVRCRELINTSGVETHAAMHDPLTGTANRRQFEQQLNELVAESAPRHMLLMLDLDRFKPVNDLYGHAAGDALLKEISAGLSKLVNSRDTVARLGGDEFAIILNQTDQERAESVTLAALEFVTKYRMNWDGHRISVGTSIGLVNIASDTLSFKRIDAGTPSPVASAKSHQPEDGRQQALFGLVAASASKTLDVPEDRQGSRRRHEIKHWIVVEPRTIGDDMSPGMQVRELIEDASARSDGGADLARWVLLNALNAVAYVTPSVIDRIGFVLPIPARAVVTVPNLGEELMRMNALAHLPLRHITFLLYSVGSVYNAPEIELFRQRLSSSDVAIGFEVRASTLDVLAPMRHVNYEELHLGRELSRNLRPGTSGFAALESLLTTAEQNNTTVVASGIATADEIRQLSALGVNRFTGPVVADPVPLKDILQKMQTQSENRANSGNQKAA